MTNDRAIDPAIQAAIQSVRTYLAQGSLLERGLNHNEIWGLQRNLNRLGFTASRPDGAFGPATAQDVMGFLSQPRQREFLTEISPYIYRELLDNGQGELLRTRMADQVNLLIGGSDALNEDQIKRLQRGLEYATGKDLGHVDGKIGKQTLNVLHDFIQEQDRAMMPEGQSLMLELNGNLLIGAEPETIERFQNLLERVPRETRLNWLHDHADEIRAGDAQRNTTKDNGAIAQGQLMLRSLGYDAGDVDGLIGDERSRTRRALDECLRDNPEDPNRIIDRTSRMADAPGDSLRRSFFSADQGQAVLVTELAKAETAAPDHDEAVPTAKPVAPLV